MKRYARVRVSFSNATVGENGTEFYQRFGPHDRMAAAEAFASRRECPLVGPRHERRGNRKPFKRGEAAFLRSWAFEVELPPCCGLGRSRHTAGMKAASILWSYVIGVACGLIAGLLVFCTAGVWVLFALFWGCNPSHRLHPDLDPCSDLLMAAVVLAVAFTCLAVAAIGFVVTRRVARR